MTTNKCKKTNETKAQFTHLVCHPSVKHIRPIPQPLETA